MPAPYCKTCKAPHYGTCADYLARNAPPEATEPATAPKAEKPTITKASPAKPPAEALKPTHCPTCGHPLAKFDRDAYHRTYMRDYMRKKRSTPKPEKPK